MANKKTRDSDSYASLKHKDIVNIALALSSLRDRLLLLLLSDVGLSLSELSGLRVSDVSRRDLVVGPRRVRISAKMHGDLRAFVGRRGQSSHVFTGRDGGRLSQRRIQQIVMGLTGSSPHKLRQIAIAHKAVETPIDTLRRETGLSRLRQRDTLTDLQVDALNDAAAGSAVNSAMLNLLLETGCHLNELVGIRVSDVLADRVRVGGRIVRISPAISELVCGLCKGRNGRDFLFSSRQGGPISEKRVFQIIRGIGKPRGIAVNPRMIRNTAILRFISLGHRDREVMDRFGLGRIEFSNYGLLRNG